MYTAFMDLCEDIVFDTEAAKKVLSKLDLSQEFVISPRWKGRIYSPNVFTPLSMAIFYTNLAMVELLLSLGANPNVIYNGYENVLWDLQYNDGETDEENEQRLLIAQRLLECGADPLVAPEKTGVLLFDYVVFAVFNNGFDESWDYLSRFLILLVAFGAKSKYCAPRIVGVFDKTNMKQYDFFVVPEVDGRYSGVIVDGQGNDVAYV